MRSACVCNLCRHDRVGHADAGVQFREASRSKSRAATIGMPSVLKYPRLARLKTALTPRFELSCSTHTSLPHEEPPIGTTSAGDGLETGQRTDPVDHLGPGRAPPFRGHAELPHINGGHDNACGAEPRVDREQVAQTAGEEQRTFAIGCHPMDVGCLHGGAVKHAPHH